ncbi:AAA family ATPase [Flavobacterium procerum]|uniref:AAA family ATPase n=1 Tax=Flavobacterium procerum TaxID=1455569 RepID=A0ABV6BU84_9FLAO
MKISKLHINQFRHLENLEFDFTYQSGERKGEPLDKICFIGQSATGKTGLLDLLYQESSRLQNAVRFEEITENITPSYNNSDNISSGIINFISNTIIRIFEIEKSNNDVIFFKSQTNEKLSDFELQNLAPIKENISIFYFKANLISDKNIDIFTKNPIDLIEMYRQTTEINIENFLDKSFNHQNILFNDNVSPKNWLFLLSEILEYRKNFTQKMSELINNGNFKGIEENIKKWQKNNPNKVESFGKEFNPLLEKLQLEVDLVNTKYPIPLKKKKTEEIISIENTSTGTKGLLLSFLPLYKLDTSDSIVLIDEPERSLYPDMQMELMDHYKRLAPQAQFIVATHSPFIAASFEPDERFILYFDNEGKVVVRRGTSPIGDDPNDMLYNDFGINYINKYGQEKYQEYLDLKQKIYFENDPKKKEEISEQLEKLGDEYNF